MCSRMSRFTLFNRWLDSLPKSYNEWFIAIVATTAGTMFGCDVSSISAFISEDAYRKFFNYPNSTQQGAITAAVSAGCLVGSLASEFFAEPLGRRTTLIVSCLLWILGAIIQSTCRNVVQLALGRCISGSAIGIGSVIAPTYISEISRARRRGLFGGLYQLAITFGILVMFYIGFGCTHIAGTDSFRAAWALQMIPGLLLLCGIPFLPESPRWLANHDRWAQAEAILRKVYVQEAEEVMLAELAEVRESVAALQTSQEMRYRDLFNSDNWRSTTVGISAQIWNQMTGFNVMMYYIVYIFEMIGYKKNAVLTSSSIQYVIQFVVTLLSLPLVDLVGRRTLMLIGGVLMMVFLFINGSLFAVYSVPIPNIGPNDTVVVRIPDDHASVGKAIAAFSYLYVAAFSSTWAVVSWAFFAEALPNRTRTKAGSIAVAFNWACNFALAMFTPPAFRNISWKIYFVFGTFCGAMTIHCFFQFPETKGRTLEEIDYLFRHKVPAWRTRSYVIPLEQLGQLEHELDRSLEPKLGIKSEVEWVEDVSE